MKKVKVLFFIYQMGAGGAARTLLNIINNLDRGKFSPVLVTLNFDGSYESELKSDVTFIKLDTQRLRHAIFPLAKIIRRHEIDLVFSTIPNVNTIAILAKLLSFTKVRSVIREADNLGGSFLTNLKLIGFGMMYRFSNQIVSLSEGVKQNLVRRYKVSPKSIKVIYNPVDNEAIQEKIAEGEMSTDHQQLFDTDDKVIITAGRLVPQKDHHTLLRAFAKVNQHMKSRLIILGEGYLKDELVELTKELNINEQVHFIGFQKNPYVYIKEADLFVLSSVHEGFSHVIAEALATGTLVVSTNCKSGPSEVLNNGQYGELCAVGNVDEMAQKIKEVLSLHPEEVEIRINNGYRRAYDFDAKKIVKSYEDTFLSVLK